MELTDRPDLSLEIVGALFGRDGKVAIRQRLPLDAQGGLAIGGRDHTTAVPDRVVKTVTSNSCSVRCWSSAGMESSGWPPTGGHSHTASSPTISVAAAVALVGRRFTRAGPHHSARPRSGLRQIEIVQG